MLGRNASTFGEGDHCGAFCVSCQLLSDTRSVEEAVAWEQQGVSVEYDTPVVPWRWPCLYLISQSEMTENEQMLEKRDVDPIKRVVALTAKVQCEHSDFFFIVVNDVELLYQHQH